MLRRIRLALLTTSLLGIATYASAQDRSRPSLGTNLGVVVGYGIDLTNEPLNLFGFGLGLRGGHSFEPGFYLGGQFMYFMGESETRGVGEISANLVTLGIEAGYDALAVPFILRPSLGIGLGFLNGTATSPDGSEFDDSSSELYLAPGASLIYPVEAFFVGLDGRFFIIVADESRTGLTANATLGVNF